jgi:membrane protein DedA with SNARE-associated domain
MFAKYGVWAVMAAMILPAPSPLFYMAAGETGMPFAIFLAADVAGTLLYIAGYLAIGWVAGQHAVDLAGKISQYGLVSTIALIAAIVAWSTYSGWRGTRENRQASE